jgi:hypothetical protein
LQPDAGNVVFLEERAMSMVTVVFRNTTGFPVNVQFIANDFSGGSETLYTGYVSGLSGVFSLPTGFMNFTCNVKPYWSSAAGGSVMRLPVISRSSAVTVVFQQLPGVQQ